MAGPAFAAILRHHRLAAGLSQEDLAEQARMSARGIGALERGDPPVSLPRDGRAPCESAKLGTGRRGRV